MIYDVIVIGKGPAGISASLYIQRANLNTLIIGQNNSALAKAKEIENYFGLKENLSGETLLKNGENQATKLGVEVINDDVTAIKTQYDDHIFTVLTASGEYEGRAILIATGQPHKKIRINGLKDFEGKGISYCTTCDGFFYKGLGVGVLGYNNYAVQEAMELKVFTKDITILTNGKKLEVSDSYAEMVKQFNIKTQPVTKVEGTQFLNRIHFDNGETQSIDGLFIAYGTASSVDFAKKFGIETDGNAIVVNESQETNIEGIYAAGDCTGGFKQIATAVGQGAVAGKSMIEYVRNIKKQSLSA